MPSAEKRQWQLVLLIWAAPGQREAGPLLKHVGCPTPERKLARKREVAAATQQ